MRDDLAEISPQTFLWEAIVSSSSMGRDVHSLTFVRPAFPVPTTASPTFQGTLQDGFAEAVVARDMPEPCSTTYETLMTTAMASPRAFPTHKPD